MVYRIYLNVSYYCNVTYKNVYFTLRYIIVDISNKYIEETLMKDARLNRPLIKIFEHFIAAYFLIFHYLPITVKVFVNFSCFCGEVLQLVEIHILIHSLTLTGQKPLKGPFYIQIQTTLKSILNF